MNIRVCACPTRDRKNIEKAMVAGGPAFPKVRQALTWLYGAFYGDEQIKEEPRSSKVPAPAPIVVAANKSMWVKLNVG